MIRVTAHAKINLFLEITGKRPDGYHTLSTVFQTISLGDELTVAPAAKLSLTCSDRSLPVDERNLAMRAALRLQAALKESRGAAIHLKKKVPTGAGLGGGSSDAACVLRALLKLWGRRIGVSALEKLAVELGADVPFFLKGGICAATGIGEKLRPLKPLPKTWLVLVYPGFGVSTKEAYAKVRLPFNNPRKLNKSVIARSVATKQSQTSEIATLPSVARNDCLLFNRFEDFIFPDYPQLPRLKQDLLDAGATASLMSGSGSSIFGIADSQSQGAQILARIQKKYNQCWLVHTL
jgi:4-diphosphocytidyl-2-C-methyl-D-erythritol kinase